MQVIWGTGWVYRCQWSWADQWVPGDHKSDHDEAEGVGGGGGPAVGDGGVYKQNIPNFKGCWLYR